MTDGRTNTERGIRDRPPTGHRHRHTRAHAHVENHTVRSDGLRPPSLQCTHAHIQGCMHTALTHSYTHHVYFAMLGKLARVKPYNKIKYLMIIIKYSETPYRTLCFCTFSRNAKPYNSLETLTIKTFKPLLKTMILKEDLTINPRP